MRITGVVDQRFESVAIDRSDDTWYRNIRIGILQMQQRLNLKIDERRDFN